MVVYFNKKDMVSFANFVVKEIRDGKKIQDTDGKYPVSHADFMNWKEQQEHKNNPEDINT